jgi:hypothetical protein
VLARYGSRKREDRFEQTDLRVSDGKLRRVDTNSDASGSCGSIVAGQRCLTPLIETAVCVERQRMRGNDESFEEPFPQILTRHLESAVRHFKVRRFVESRVVMEKP